MGIGRCPAAGSDPALARESASSLPTLLLWARTQISWTDLEYSERRLRARTVWRTRSERIVRLVKARSVARESVKNLTYLGLREARSAMTARVA